MTYSLIAAIGLVLILEGVMPFLVPNLWRKMVSHLSEQSDRSLRITGLVFMVIGIVILFLAHRYL